MKVFALLMCTAFLITGCSTTVKAVPARERRVVLVEQHRHRHKKPKRVVVGRYKNKGTINQKCCHLL